MSLTKLSVVANMALAASAVLLPPSMAAAETGDDHALETFAVDPFKRSVALECPGCPFAVQKDNKISWEDGTGSAYQLDFEIGQREDTLDISGFQLYPPSLSGIMSSFYVTQIDPKSESSVRLLVTGFNSHFSSASTVSETGTELLPLSFQITSLEGVSVNPPELKINLLKNAEGKLMIASFEDVSGVAADTSSAKEDCKQWPLLCKWKAIVAERIGKMRKPGHRCHKHPHGHSNAVEAVGSLGDAHDRFQPGRPHHEPHHRPHHQGHSGHGRHRHHGMQVFLRRAFFTILIPILIGIFAGTVTYLMGMAIGCLVAMVIAKVRGQSYRRIALEEDMEDGEVLIDRKEDFAELPAYDAPPVYEEAAEEKEKGDEAK